jgi:hypothetical protein
MRDRKPERGLTGASSVFTKSVSILGDGGYFPSGFLWTSTFDEVSLITDIVGVVIKPFCRLRIIRWIRMVYI